jgi:threonine aldolase
MSTSPVELFRARKLKSPEETCLELAQACNTLQINNQDTYGDYSLAPDQSWLRKFENEVASLFGYEDGLFLPSGVMAQQIAILVHDETQNTKSFICHYSSHIILRENESYHSLLQFNPKIIPSKQDSVIQYPVAYDDVVELVTSIPRSSSLIIECPHREIGGKCTSWDDLVQISTLCRCDILH